MINTIVFNFKTKYNSNFLCLMAPFLPINAALFFLFKLFSNLDILLKESVKKLANLSEIWYLGDLETKRDQEQNLGRDLIKR